MNARQLPPKSASAFAPGVAVRADMAFELLPGNIGHLVLRSFEDPGLPQRFAAAFERISATAALVVDLRQASGAGSAQAWQILAWLMNKPFSTVRWMGPASVLVRRRTPFAAAGLPAAAGQPWKVTPAYPRPLAVLLGAATEGAAEDFAVTVTAAHRGLLWGEPTGGISGAKGRPGVQPHHLLRASAEEARAGRDSVLLAACQALQAQLAAPAKPVVRPLQEHAARGFDALGVDPAGVGRQQRGHHAADVVGEPHPA